MIKILKQKNKKSGFTLVETLVAVFILSLSIITMMTVLSSGISDTNYAKQKITATYLAQEGIEYMRNIRDDYVLYPTMNPSLTWSSFKNMVISKCENGCGFDNNNADFTVTNQGFILQCFLLYSCKLYVNDGNYYYSANQGTDSGFRRVITADKIGDDEIKITSTVFWNQGSGEKSVSFSENLFNWTNPNLSPSL